MNPESPEDDWLDRAAARRANPEERRQWIAELSAAPAQHRRLLRELALNDLLDAHRPAPRVSSNFAALVVAEVTRPTRSTRADRSWSAWADWRHWFGLPRIAALAVLLLAVGTGWNNLETRQQRQIARGAAEVGRTTTATGLDADSLANFDVIRHLGSGPRPEDDALMLALAQ